MKNKIETFTNVTLLGLVEDMKCLKRMDNRVYLAIFFLGQFFTAFGITTLNLFGLPLLQENVSAETFPLFTGNGQSQLVC